MSATIEDVSKATSLSLSTVRAALYDGFVSEKTRSRVKDAAHQLGYVAPIKPRTTGGFQTRVPAVCGHGTFYPTKHASGLCNACNRKARRASGFIITYVCKDAQGSVIYVGRASGYHRFQAHKNNSPWWPEVDNILTRKHNVAHPEANGYAQSMVLEAMLVRKYQPKYNLNGVIR